jgi:GT2 family glycosyltransferase
VCDADDLWEPDKLARQRALLRADREVDVAFGAVRVFGALEGRWPPADDSPPAGPLDPATFPGFLYRLNAIVPSATLVRRELFERIGPFAADVASEDYDFWLRALKAGALFAYDPAFLARYRRHELQLTQSRLWMHEAILEAHANHAGWIGDRRLVHTMLAADHLAIGRLLVDDGRAREARSAFLQALRHARGLSVPSAARASAWVAVLTLPAHARGRAGQGLVSLKRAAESVRGERRAALP